MAISNTRKSAQELHALLRHWQEEVPDDRLAHLVKDVRRGMTRSLQMRLAQHAIAFGHWTFLRILWQKDGLTQRELSEQAGVMEPTTFTAVKAMERLGYIVRRQQPDSRKKVYVFLTHEGRVLRDLLVPKAVEVNEIAIRGIAPDAVETTRRTLLAMIANLAEDEARSARQERRIASTQEVGRSRDGSGRPEPSDEPEGEVGDRDLGGMDQTL